MTSGSLPPHPAGLPHHLRQQVTRAICAQALQNPPCRALFFAAKLAQPMRALGLDVGSKTIGIAVTDEAEIAAHPHGVLARAGTARDVSTILTLVGKLDITDLVVGMPFELSGKLGHRGKRVQEFAN